mgnify:CR=1 FL=1
MSKNLGEKFKEALARIEEIEKSKRDVLIKPSNLHMDNRGSLHIDGLGPIDFTKTGFQHFCMKADLPSSYMMKLLDTDGKSASEIEEDLETFKINMRRGLNRLRNDKEYFFRTLQHSNSNKYRVRAIFSDNYRVFDNLPILRQLQNFDGEKLETQGFSVTSDFMDIRFTLPDLKTSIGKLPQHEVRFGLTDDIIFPGIHLRNSETGGSKIKGRFIIYRLVCTNGLSYPRHEFTIIDQKHMGDFDVTEINDRLGSITVEAKSLFNNYVERLQDAKTKTSDPDEIFNFIQNRKSITKKMTEVVRKNWETEQRMGRTKFDYINAVTAGARDWENETKDYTGRLNLEDVAGELLFSKAI